MLHASCVSKIAIDPSLWSNSCVTLSTKLLLRGSTPQRQHTWLTIGAVIAFFAA